MKQKTALEIPKSGKNVFITGSAGTEDLSSSLYRQYLKEKISEDDKLCYDDLQVCMLFLG